MKKLVSTAGLTHEEWLRYRKRGIGGSDAGAVCGVNPYRSALEVYLDKTSENVMEKADNEAMRQGRELEDYVARRFMEATGKKVRRVNAMFYDEKHPFMLADVDRMVIGESAGLECKTASPYAASQWEDGKIPPSYLAQCRHYMSVMGTQAWYIAVLIYGTEFKYYRIEREQQELDRLIRTEENFWNGHVLTGIMPPPDGSESDDRAILGYFGRPDGSHIRLEGFDEKLHRREELNGIIGQMETEKRQIEQELKLYMGNAETAENENYRVSWKTYQSIRLDEKRLKEEAPDIFREYKKETCGRRFTVKAA